MKYTWGNEHSLDYDMLYLLKYYVGCITKRSSRIIVGMKNGDHSALAFKNIRVIICHGINWHSIVRFMFEYDYS